MDVIVIFQRLQKRPYFPTSLITQFRIVLRNKTQFARHHCPPILFEPIRHPVHRSSFGQKSSSTGLFRNIIILLMG